MLNIYISGKWSHKNIIKPFIEAYQKEGFNITHDWTRVEDIDKKSDKELSKYAKLDIESIAKADILVIIISDPKYTYRGTCVELGAAIALNKSIIIIDLCNQSNFSYNLFTKHPNIKYLVYPTNLELLIELDTKLLNEIIVLSTAYTTLNSMKLEKK